MIKLSEILKFIEEDKNILEPYLKNYENKKSNLKEYIIGFTPRSGSSWLTHLLTSTQLTGKPEEWFNPNSLVMNFKRYGCLKTEDYLKSIKADQSSENGLFGVKTTWYQLNLILENCSFEDIFNQPKLIYLTRKDFIAQSISLYKSVTTGYFHSYQEVQNNINNIQYDPIKIKYWMLHILRQEYEWEHFFTKQDLSPLRIFYEDLVVDISRVIQNIFDYLDLSVNKLVIPEQNQFLKLADQTNEEFSDQFKHKMKDFIDTCEQYRGKYEILKIQT